LPERNPKAASGDNLSSPPTIISPLVPMNLNVLRSKSKSFFWSSVSPEKFLIKAGKRRKTG